MYLVWIAGFGAMCAVDATGWKLSAGVGLFLAAAAAVLVRQRSPCVLLAVAWLTTALMTPVLVAPAVFALTVRRRGRSTIAASAITIGILAGASSERERLVAIDGVGHDVLSGRGGWLLEAVVLIVIPCVLGLTVGARRELVASYRLRAELAESERAARTREVVLLERARIAGEAHDVLGHKLALLAMQAGGLELNAEAGVGFVERQAQLIGQSARGALDDLRAIIGRLDNSDEPHSIPASVPDGLRGIQELIAESRASGAAVLVNDSKLTEGVCLPEAMMHAVYRFVQEGLTNAHRHAPEAPIVASFSGSPGGKLVVEIRNTVDVEPLPHSARRGRGLPALEERIKRVGGDLDVEESGSVFVLRARLPWEISPAESDGCAPA